MRFAVVVVLTVLGLWGVLRPWSSGWPRVLAFGALLGSAYAALPLFPFSLSARFARARDRGLSLKRAAPAVTEADLQRLPAAAQRYLRRVGVVGLPRVYNFRATFSGMIRTADDAPWMQFKADQYSFLEPATRLFLIEASRGGIPFRGLHELQDDSATMRVRVAELITAVEASGPEMLRSETVTYFNDLWLLAPAALLDADITWLQSDEHVLQCRFRRRGVEIGATLYFDAEGDLVNFVSLDRSKSADGKHFDNYPWATPLSAYRQFGDVRLWSHGDAVWHEPGADVTYGRFVLESVEYNVSD